MDDSIFSLQYDDSIPPLSKAAKTGDLEKIKKLLARGQSPQLPDNRGWTPVHYCVAGNQEEALKLILELNTDAKAHLVNLASWENVTPLMIALKASEPSIIMVEILLKAGADPNQSTRTKLSPLHLACLKKGNIDFVKVLVDFGADVNTQEDLALFTPLHCAASESCDLEIVKYLVNLSDLTLENVYGRNAFLEACSSNFLEGVQAFLENSKNLANQSSDIPPIAYASVLGNLKMVQMLIDSGADVNLKCKALVPCKSESAYILLDRKCFLPIHSSLKNIEVFKLLLNLTDINELLQSETHNLGFLHFLLIYGDEMFIETLLQSHLPDKLKTCRSDVLLTFVQCNPDMEDISAEKFLVFFKYNFQLQPNDIFHIIFCQIPDNGLHRTVEMLHLLSQIGISSMSNTKYKSPQIFLLQEGVTFFKDLECSEEIKSAIELLSQSVLSLKHYCRIAVRKKLRSSVSSDWLAVQAVKESNLSDSLKKFILFESFD